MIQLRDSIEIRTKPERIFNWLETLPSEYRSWHPDHVSGRVLDGAMFHPGSLIEFQEYLHGKLHSLRFRPTKIEPGNCYEFDILGFGKGAFRVVTKGAQTEFVAELALGTTVPILGQLVDAALRAFFRRQMEALQQHMREEGQNLRQLLEAG